MKNKIIMILLAMCLLFQMLPVYAESPNDVQSITIDTTQDFIEFTKNCRIDSYSKSLSVVLKSDIDLTGVDFQPIPIFCGEFYGNGHSITGLSVQYSGSACGLFRYLTAEATVKDLNVFGAVFSSGSGDQAGGIAGNNAGTIVNCTFSGTVSGIEFIGAIAGKNSGSIESCQSNGIISGSHFVGGIAGINTGIVSDCINRGKINTDPAQMQMDITDVTINSITSTESSFAVTDIGGIAGSNLGTVSRCENHGTVGYLHIGYNIGGICGISAGYVESCANYGMIYGRKEIGGVIGQLEPSLNLVYSTDAIQILGKQMKELSTIASRLGQSIIMTAEDTLQGIIQIQDQINDLEDLFEQLNVQDPSSINDTVSKIQVSLSAITTSLQQMLQQLQNASDDLLSDMEKISFVINKMQKTIDSATEKLGSTVVDVSLSDSDAENSSEIWNCQNHGEIFADLNGGGIIGAVAFESDLDPEEDITISGDSSLNLSGEFRAVIRSCQNFAPVTVRKQFAGGIVGFLSLGAVNECNNTGHLKNDRASYVGAIAGYSQGYIKNCNAKCMISAKSFAGGIAGQAANVSFCRSMCQVNASEKRGAISGFASSPSFMIQNFYVPVVDDVGGIDGISYASCAESLSISEFIKLDDLPSFFSQSTAAFHTEDDEVIIIKIQPGEIVPTHKIPAATSKPDTIAFWTGIDEPIYFDTDFYISYESYHSVFESVQKRENDLSIILAECAPSQTNPLQVTFISTDLPADAIEGFVISTAEITQLRYLPPLKNSASQIEIYGQSLNGDWILLEHTTEGSYAVFEPKGAISFYITASANQMLAPYIIVGGIMTIVAICIIIIIFCRKKSRKEKERTTP